MLWDTAGQEEFDAITKAYYRGMVQENMTLQNLCENTEEQDIHAVNKTRTFIKSVPQLQVFCSGTC